MLKQKRAMARPAPKDFFFHELFSNTKTPLVRSRLIVSSLFSHQNYFSPPKVSWQAPPLLVDE
jgi:hypothetical protein